jgi:hypothetical protein
MLKRIRFLMISLYVTCLQVERQTQAGEAL